MQDSSARGQAPPRNHSYLLRFISGKYQGGEFPVVADKQIIVGRSSDLDMVLVEDMVSRKHARIVLQSDGIWIEDLGSTNGTFVNGEKIKRSRLKEGDRVLIGTSILKVVTSDSPPAESITTSGRVELESVAAQRRTNQTRTMSGAIEEVPLPDLLQLFGTSKKNGVLVVRTEDDVGRIFMRRGNIYFAQINDVDDLAPMKCMFRMLTWQKGLFDLDPPDERTFGSEIDVTVQEVLMEGLRQLDEFEQLRPSLPSLDARLAIASPLTALLRDLAADELDIVQLAMTYGSVAAVLYKSRSTDLETAQTLLKLLKTSYLRAL
jgi:hypothetical protein